MTESIELTLVVPMYNSAEILPHLYRCVAGTLSGIVHSFEMIAVVD